jgi:hypothetical protein
MAVKPNWKLVARVGDFAIYHDTYTPKRKGRNYVAFKLRQVPRRKRWRLNGSLLSAHQAEVSFFEAPEVPR